MSDDGIIANLQDLGELLAADGDTEAELKDRIERHVYKYTDCGAWISFHLGGIKIGSIVEGSDNGTSTFRLDYPFKATDYRAAEAAIEKEASAIWEWANAMRFLCPTCVEVYGEEEMAKRKSDGDMHGKVKCDRCGKVMHALAFNVHECKGMRNLNDLPTPILRQLAMGQINEAQAWRLFDGNQT